MKNFLRIALVIAVVLCVAIAMVACGGDDTTTTTAGKTTTAAPGTTAGDPATTTTVVTTTVVDTTTVEPLGLFLVPNVYYNDELVDNVWLFDAWGMWCLTDDNMVMVEVGAAIGELVGLEFTKGTIEVKMTMNEDASTAKTGDSGFCFALSDPFDAEYPYYFETQASYYFVLVSDSQGLGVSRVGFTKADGTIAGWHWMPNADGNGIVAGPFYEDGGDVVIKIETDGATYIDCYIDGELVSEISIPEGENLFTNGGTINNKVAYRGEGAGLKYHYIKINQVED